MLAEFVDCLCISNKRNHSFCASRYSIDEKGKKAKLEPKSGESVWVYAFDGCICTDNAQLKCDALFVLQKNNNQLILLSVELKGVEWEHGLEQLSYTRKQNSDYKRLKTAIVQQSGNVYEKSVLVTSASVDKVILKKFETTQGIRVHVSDTLQPTNKPVDLQLYC
jgi:hypothetical protein